MSRLFTLTEFEYPLVLALAIKLVWMGLVIGLIMPLNTVLTPVALFVLSAGAHGAGARRAEKGNGGRRKETSFTGG